MQVERNSKPLTALLQQISSLTGGQARKLDMGSAKAAAVHINAQDMQQLLERLTAELELTKQFEVAYAQRLNLERCHSTGVGTNPVARPQRPGSSAYQHVKAKVLLATVMLH